MATKRSKPASTPLPEGNFDEERVPFDDVLRKLVNAKPAHKSAPPAKPAKEITTKKH